MEALILIYFFILGSVFGSFYNVVGLRIPNGQSIIHPRSHCTNCGHELSWYELVPILSFLFLRGRCNSCGTKIEPLHPVIEAVTGILFALAYYELGFTWEFAYALVFISMLVIITVSDLAYMIIPDKILAFFLCIFILLSLIKPLLPWWDSLIGAAAGFGILFLLSIVSKGGMGGGDIKLFLVIGLYLGTKATLFTLFFASFFGALFGIVLMVLGKFKKGTPVPFGPFISLGAVIAYFYSESIWQWYFQLILQ